MSFTLIMVIFIVVACMLYGVILWLGRRRQWGVNRTAIVESLLFLVCGVATSLAWNSYNEVENTLTSTVIAPIVIGLFAYFQTAFFYARLEASSANRLSGAGHKAGKPQYDRERRKRIKRWRKK